MKNDDEWRPRMIDRPGKEALVQRDGWLTTVGRVKASYLRLFLLFVVTERWAPDEGSIGCEDSEMKKREKRRESEKEQNARERFGVRD